MDMKFSSVCVAGGGSWGTALAHVAACGGHATTLYLRDETVCRAINEVHVNPRYLPSHPVHPDVAASTDPAVLGAPLDRRALERHALAFLLGGLGGEGGGR